MSYSKLFTVYEPIEKPPIITEEVEQAQEEYNNLIDHLDQLSLGTSITSPEDWSAEFELPESFFESKTENPYKFEVEKPAIYNYSPSIAEQAIDFAEQFVGSKYTWGGISPSTGFDCSGIGYYSFRKFGIDIPRQAKDMAKFGVEVPIDQVRKGDWIVTGSKGRSGHHVVWVMGRGDDGSIKVINAKGQKDGVIYDTFTNFKNVIAVRRLPQQSTQLTTNKSTPSFGSKENYTRTMYRYIYRALQNNGIDADIWTPLLVAQTALESGWGNEFSRRNNNYGGIKGKGSGATATKEFIPGKGYVVKQDSFKSYPSIEAFADDFVKKLKNEFNAFNGAPSEYLSNIKSKGYFTAPLSDYSKMFNTCLKTIRSYLS